MMKKSVIPSILPRLLLGICLASASALDASAADDVESNAVLRALLAGRDTSVEAALAEQASAEKRVTHRVEASAMQRFDQALSALRTGLAKARTDAAYDFAADVLRLNAADALVQASFDEIESALPASARARLIVRLQEARARWQSAVDPVLAGAERISASGKSGVREADIAALLGHIDSRADAGESPIYGAQTLPQHRPRLLPRAPRLQPDVAPSYGTPADVQIFPEDLAPGSEAALAPVVLEQARALGNDYIAIFDFVRTQIRTQWYAGAQKGAEETLRTRAGNDIDQASLLIALLRASRAPSRYVTGVVEVPVDQLSFQLGVGEQQVGAALAAAGIAHSPVVAQGRVAAFRIEQVWVSTHVPYGNYRGTSADEGARSWIPLMPALKPAEFRAALPVVGPASLQVETWVEEFLSSTPSELPWPALRRELSTRLAQLDPPINLDDRSSNHALTAEPLLLLPASTPYRVVAVNLEVAELLDEQRQWLRLTLRAADSSDSPAILSKQWPLSAIRGHRVGLGYVPATVEDQHLANARGGFGRVPSYLMRVRPSLWLDGRPLTSGEGVLEVGRSHRIEIELHGPGGSVSADQVLRAGGVAALSLDLQGDAVQVDTEDVAMSEPPALRLLGRLSQRYQQDWSAADAQIGAALGATVMRPLPGATLAIGQYRVDEVFGLAESLEFDGVALDALLRPVEPVSQGTDALAEADWMRVSSLHGSALEHHIYSQLWGVEAVSADVGLQQATARGLPKLRLHPGDDVDSILAAHALSVRTNVSAWLHRGLDVDIPRDPMTFEAWTGSAWRAINPSTGETGYFVSGNYAGGITVIPPGFWYFEDLAAQFADPYGPAPNDDPLSGILIQLDPDAQNQEGTVNEILPRPLRAFLSDEVGRPVQGAKVTFRIRRGGGKLSSFGVESDEFDGITDGRGIAGVDLRLPAQQQGLGNFFHKADREHPDWGSLIEVSVEVVTANGPLATGVPYRAHAFAGEAASLELVTWRPNPEPGTIRSVYPGVGYVSILARAHDQFSNLVANANVAISTSDSFPYPRHCVLVPSLSAQSRLFLPGQCPSNELFLQPNDCATPSIRVATERAGAWFGLVPHRASEALMRVVATVENIDHADLVATLELGTRGQFGDDPDEPSLPCTSGVSVQGTAFPRLLVQYTHRLFSGYIGESLFEMSLPESTADESFEAMLAGSPMAEPRRVKMLVNNHDWNFSVDWHPYTDAFFAPRISSISGATASPVLSLGNGDYEYSLTGGAAPGKVTGTIKTLEVPSPIPPAWTVDLPPPLIEPDIVRLSAFQRSLGDFEVRVPLMPDGYRAQSITIEILADGDVESQCSQWIAGRGFYCRFLQGRSFDPTKRYTARYAINHGTPFYLVSGETELRFSRGIIVGFGADESSEPPPTIERFAAWRYPSHLKLRQEIDVSNQLRCDESTRFIYAVGQPAAVSLRFFALDEDGQRGPLQWDAVVGEPRTRGVFELAITQADLPVGEYEYELRATAASDGAEEVFSGRASSIVNRRDSLSLAHSFVKGVDLHLGHAVISAEDIAVGGRGPGLRLTRTYASHAGDELTYLGRGWHTDLDSQVTVDRCGMHIVTGSAGQGQRFVTQGTRADGTPDFRALNGYHGSLYRRDDGSFDFYSKDGTRYHFAEPDVAGARLSFVEDTNGNRVTYEYDQSTVPPQVRRITDGSQRSLNLFYRTVLLDEGETVAGVVRRETRQLLSSVSGPLGSRVDYGYDVDGNLQSVLRTQNGLSGHKRTRYGYTNLRGIWLPDPEGEFKYHHFGHRLVTARNDIDGSERTYEYQLGWSGVQTPDGPIFVPEQRVVKVKEADASETAYLFEGIRGLSPVGTTVTDARGHATVYSMNAYGATEMVVDPAGTTRTVWDLSALQPFRVTDALGTVTEYTYDVHGNKLSERVQHEEGTLNRRWSYHAPEEFLIPIKDRIDDAFDARGIQTRTSWDSRGNLTGTTRGGVTERYGVAINGDRVSRTDGNNDTTQYRYDVHGYLVEESDQLGDIRGSEFDALGRMLLQRDGNGNRTRFTYDVQDRLIGTRHRAAVLGLDGGLFDAESSTQYLDASRQRIDINANEEVTITTHDAMGRVVSVVDSSGGERALGYDRNGNTTRETDFRGNETTYEYDSANRLIRKSEPLGRTTDYTHDALGHILSETTAERATQYLYEHPLNLRTHVRRRLGDRWLESVTGYDENGNAIRSVDARGKVTARVFDQRDRLREQSEPEGRTTILVHDDSDRLVEQTLSGPNLIAQVRTWGFDQRGREITRTDGTGGVWQTRYDLSGNVVQRMDPRGHFVNFSYDERNRLVMESGPIPDRIMRYGYDAVGNRIAELHANGRRIEHEFDDLNRLVASRDLEGGFVLSEFLRLDHDRDGNVIFRRDGNGRDTSFVVDALSRTTAERRPLDRTLAWTHTIHGEVETETDAEGHTTTHEHDALGRRTRTISAAPFEYEATTEHDDADNVIAQTNGRGLTTRWTYDDLNRRIEQTDPALSGPSTEEYSQHWVYDAAGNVVTHTDRRGIDTTTRYDGENRALERKRDGVRLQTLSYDAAGNLVTEVDANDNETTHSYNAANEKIRTERPDDVVESWTYWPWGDLRAHTDADGIARSNEYDLRRRLIRETAPASSAGDAVTEHTYDGQGNRTATIRPLGNSTTRWRYAFDAADRLRTVTSPEGAVTTYAYDLADRRTVITDAEQRATTTTYDELGRVTAVEHANGDAEMIDSYDANGNVLVRHDGAGRTITHTYDELDRLVERHTSGAAQPRDVVSEFTTYDANGQPTQVEQVQLDGTRQVTTSHWDRQGRLDDRTDRYGQTTDHVYDAQSNRSSRTDPAGRTVYQYDRLNRQRSVQPPDESPVVIEYTPAGRLLTQTAPNGAATTHDYDRSGRLSTITHRQHGTVVATLDYTYDDNGNRTEERQVTPAGTRVTTYTYDADDRLTRTEQTDETGVVTITTTTLDDVGNRRTEVVTVNGTPTANRTYSTNARHQLTQVTDSVANVTTTFTYDGNGFQTSETANGQTTTYRPNLQDRLATLTTPTGPPVEYAYDPDGLRVEKRTTTEAIRYGWDGASLRRETNVTNNLLASYDWANGRILRSRRSSQTAYAQHDALKSPIRWSRAEQGRATFDAWGTATTQTGDLPPIGYTGYYADAESDNYYAQQRYYAPTLGRFNRIDPWEGDTLRPITLNKYLYGNGNPLVWIDPDGRTPEISDVSAFLAAEYRYAANEAQMLWNAAADPSTPLYAVPGLTLSSAIYGITALGVGTAQGVADGSNLGANTVIVAADRMGAAGFATAGAASERELEQFYESAFPEVRKFEDDPQSAVSGLALQHVKQAEAALAGDANAAFGLVAQLLNPMQAMRSAGQSKAGAPQSVTIGESKSSDGPAVQMVQAAGSKPAVLLEAGGYNDLAKRSVRDDMSPDHIPSFAARKAAMQQQLGRRLSDDEARQLRNCATCLMLPTSVHREASRSYGGRNTQQQIADDAGDLSAAQERDFNSLRSRLRAEGLNDEQIEQSFDRVRQINREQGIQ